LLGWEDAELTDAAHLGYSGAFEHFSKCSLLALYPSDAREYFARRAHDRSLCASGSGLLLERSGDGVIPTAQNVDQATR